MRGAIPPIPQYAFMAWFSFKAQGLYLYFFNVKTLSGSDFML
jgi:hypothetical protein